MTDAPATRIGVRDETLGRADVVLKPEVANAVNVKDHQLAVQVKAKGQTVRHELCLDRIPVRLTCTRG